MTSPTSIMIAASAPSHLAEARDSTLLQNAYLRFRVVEDNRMAGDQGRALHGTLLLLKARQEEAYRTEASERAQERYDRARRSRLAPGISSTSRASRLRPHARRRPPTAGCSNNGGRAADGEATGARGERGARGGVDGGDYARHAQREEDKQRAAAKILAAMRQESLAHNKATAARVRDERRAAAAEVARQRGPTSAASSGGEAGAVDSVMGLPAAPTGLAAAGRAQGRGGA